MWVQLFQELKSHHVVRKDFFLHPAVQPSSVGRNIVPATINMVNAFRKNGMKVLWTQASLYAC